VQSYRYLYFAAESHISKRTQTTKKTDGDGGYMRISYLLMRYINLHFTLLYLLTLLTTYIR